MRLFIDMQKFFDNWRDFIQEKEPKKEQKLLITEQKDNVYVRQTRNILRQYGEEIEKTAKKYRLSPGMLVGIVGRESRGRVKISRQGGRSESMIRRGIQGAYGPAQIQPETFLTMAKNYNSEGPLGGVLSMDDYKSKAWRENPELYFNAMGALAAYKINQGQKKFRKQHSRDMTDTEISAWLPMAWNMGAGGRTPKKFIKDPSLMNKYSYTNVVDLPANKRRLRGEDRNHTNWYLHSVANYARAYDNATGNTTSSSSTTDTADQGVKNVIISGNSHAGAMAAQVKQHYENLGQQSGVKYNFVEIHEPQGHGGQVSALNQKMDGIQSRLEGDSVAAIIHIGTNKGHGDLDELIGKYSNLSNNVTFVGTPEANKSYEDYQQRTNFNTELENKINNLDGVNFVNTFGLTSQRDLSDNVHLRKKAYGNLWSQIQGNINFDSSTSTSPSMAAGPSTSTTPQPSTSTTPQPTIRGQFVHGFSRDDTPDFNFDDFYKKLDDAGLSQHLGDWGKDYKYGRAHDAARTALSDYEANSTTTADPAPETPVTPDNMPLGTIPSQTAPIPPANMPMAATETALIPPEDMPISRAALSENIISHEYNLFESRWTAEDLIKVDMTLRFDKEFSFYGNVLNQIRAIKGITIAKADEAGLVKISPDKRLVLLHLKFMPDRPLSQYIYYIKTELKKIKDKDGDRVLSIDLKSIPEKTKS